MRDSRCKTAAMYSSTCLGSHVSDESDLLCYNRQIIFL
jgi:hypothetical protein